MPLDNTKDHVLCWANFRLRQNPVVSLKIRRASSLAREIIQRAYALDPTSLDATLASLGLSAWPESALALSFQGWDSGGSCLMLVADLPGADGHQVGITNSDAGFPTDARNFWVGIMNPDGDELYYVFVVGGQCQGYLQV